MREERGRELSKWWMTGPPTRRVLPIGLQIWGFLWLGSLVARPKKQQRAAWHRLTTNYRYNHPAGYQIVWNLTIGLDFTEENLQLKRKMTSVACSFLDLGMCPGAQCLPVISVQTISMNVTTQERNQNRVRFLHWHPNQPMSTVPISPVWERPCILKAS